MSFIKNFVAGAKIVLGLMQTKVFWSKVVKVGLPFLLLVIVISLFMSSWSDIFAGDFLKVNEVHFTEGKWQRFWGFKIALSFVYGMYVVIKRIK